MYRILGIKVKDHDHLKDFELDFTKDDGSDVSNIILAGENGNGKTKVLGIIKELIANTASGSIVLSGKPISCDIESMIKFDDTVYSFSIKEKSDLTNGYEISIKDKRGSAVQGFKPPCKIISSHTEINFVPERINSIKDNDVDKLPNGTNVFESQKDLASSIKQLLLDINSRDNSDHIDWERGHGSLPPEDFLKRKKMSRFTAAFSYMFGEDLRFDKIEGTEVLFKKNNQKFSIDNLSSGEKQIVFRGSHLIQNLNIFNGCTVLIDEPELSIHPRWQEKLLGFYNKLFFDEIDSSQIFIATHSDHVLKSALESDDAIIVRIRMNDNGTIAGERIYKNGPGKILPRITLGEVKWRVFDLPTVDFHCSLFGYLQGIEIKDSNGTVISTLPIDAMGNYRSRSIGELDDVLKSLGAPIIPMNWKNVHGYPSGQIGDKTLCAYIRNQIDHPESSDREYEIDIPSLRASIEFMESLAIYS